MKAERVVKDLNTYSSLGVTGVFLALVFVHIFYLIPLWILTIKFGYWIAVSLTFVICNISAFMNKNTSQVMASTISILFITPIALGYYWWALPFLAFLILAAKAYNKCT